MTGGRAFEVRTAYGQDFEAFCPKRHAVTSLMIEKGRDPEGNRDLRWSLKCSTLLPPGGKEKSFEKCRLKYRFAMPDGLVLFDNHWKACTCDEYLAGVKAVRYRNIRRQGLLQTQRMVQLRCCYSNNKAVNISGCYYDEQRYLLNDWDDAIQTNKKYKPKKPRDPIQGIQMIGITSLLHLPPQSSSSTISTFQRQLRPSPHLSIPSGRDALQEM